MKPKPPIGKIHWINAHCPSCGREVHFAANDRHSAHQSHPEPDDVSICWTCGQPAIYDEKLQLRKPNAAELLEIARDPEIQKMLRDRDVWRNRS